MSQERTEQPTAKRLRQFREKGRVAKSQELGGILTLFVGIYLLSTMGTRLVDSVIQIMTSSYTEIGAQRAGSMTPVWLQSQMASISLNIGLGLASWASTLLLIGVGINVVQTRGLVQPRLLIPKWERLNPLNRLKQMFGKQMLVETGKGVAKQAAIILVAYLAITSRLTELVLSANTGLRPGVTTLVDISRTMALRAAGILFLIALFDYAWQYRQHRQSLMMTKQEVKEELKQQEGSPEIKSRIRRIQRELAQQRMMAKVPTADAVIVNPTHVAVAISYNTETMAAPKIVAKGKNAVALRIISLARQNGVPVIPNKPLAWALVKLPLDAVIPPELFQAVAEVLAFVYSLPGRTPPNYAQ
jgi:flagellar biosynthetic protein FlhB